jgi:hypothetical protein
VRNRNFEFVAAIKLGTKDPDTFVNSSMNSFEHLYLSSIHAGNRLCCKSAVDLTLAAQLLSLLVVEHTGEIQQPPIRSMLKVLRASRRDGPHKNDQPIFPTPQNFFAGQTYLLDCVGTTICRELVVTTETPWHHALFRSPN